MLTLVYIYIFMQYLLFICTKYKYFNTAQAISTKKESDKYDRRKKLGTTRSSDIWSLGCLLYEILTGEFLFYDPQWANFYI